MSEKDIQSMNCKSQKQFFLKKKKKEKLAHRLLGLLFNQNKG